MKTKNFLNRQFFTKKFLILMLKKIILWNFGNLFFGAFWTSFLIWFLDTLWQQLWKCHESKNVIVYGIFHLCITWYGIPWLLRKYKFEMQYPTIFSFIWYLFMKYSKKECFFKHTRYLLIFPKNYKLCLF